MNDDQLERYLEICRRLYDKLRRDDEWPWTDSPDFDDVVESEDNSPDL